MIMKTKDETKKFSLSSVEMSELSYLVQNAETAREVSVYWQHRVQGKQNDIEKSKAIDKEKFTVDWSGVFGNSTIVCIPKPVVTPEPPKEKKK